MLGESEKIGGEVLSSLAVWLVRRPACFLETGGNYVCRRSLHWLAVAFSPCVCE